MATTAIPQLNPLDFAQAEDRTESEARFASPPRKWFAVDPDRMFPAVIGLIRAGAKPTDRSGLVDGELVRDEDAAKYLRDLARVSHATQALDDALLPLVERAEGDPLPPAETLDAPRRAARAAVLETARLWFTNELQRAVGGPIGVHILKRERWRL